MRGGRGGRWLSSSTPRPRAPGFLPQGGLGCPLWQEVGPGAPAWRCMRSGCTSFPRLQEQPVPLPPRALAPSPAGRPATARRRHLQSHPGAGSGAGGDRHLTSLPAVKESGGLEGSPVIYSILLANLLCDLEQLIRPLWATFFWKTRKPHDDFLGSFS